MRAGLKSAMLALAVSVSGCAMVAPAPRAPYDFSKVHRIKVMPFEGTGGPAATDEFIRQIVATGITVSDANHTGDVILRGTVTDYKANNPLMVFLGNTTLVSSTGQTLVVVNPMISPQSGSSTSSQVAPEAHHAQVVSVVATAAIDVVLLDASTKTLLWRASQSYEGLDLAETLRTTTGCLTRALSAVLPAMRRKSS